MKAVENWLEFNAESLGNATWIASTCTSMNVSLCTFPENITNWLSRWPTEFEQATKRLLEMREAVMK